MLKRRSLLALSIALCLNAQAGTDIKQYNYDDTISNKDIGVDDENIDCICTTFIFNISRQIKSISDNENLPNKLSI